MEMFESHATLRNWAAPVLQQHQLREERATSSFPCHLDVMSIQKPADVEGPTGVLDWAILRRLQFVQDIDLVEC